MKRNERRRAPRFSSDRRGVSETLGDILLVVTSVVMLTALAVQLLGMPPPAGTLEADTVATFDGVNVTVEHVGGADLKDSDIIVEIGKNYSNPSVFSIVQGHPDGVLTVGESWSRNVSSVVSPDDRVHVIIVDKTNSRVLSDQYIVRPQDYTALPDIGLTPADITFWRAGELVDDEANAALEGDIVTINMTVHNYGKVPVSNVSVASSTFMYTATALPMQQIAFLNSSGNPGDRALVSAQWTVGDWGPHTIYVRVIPLRNETIFTNNYVSRQIRIGPGIVTPDAPDLNITAVYFSNSHPVHGDAVKFYVRIANQGGVPAAASLTYWDSGNPIFTEYNISVSSGQVLEVYTVWMPTIGGVHLMFTNVSVTNGPPDDADPNNNNRTVYVEVLPTILVVDDDKAADGSLKDVTSPMKAALSACAAQYTLYQVSGGDGPKYDTGPAKRRLSDFDLVIWLTGYESTSTLTPNDVVALTEYQDHGGKLWLIGQDVVNDLRSTSAAWLSGRLHVSGQVLDAGSYNPLEGVPDNNVTRNMTLPMNTVPWAGGLTDLSDKLVNDSRSVAAFWNSSTTSKYGLMFNASTNGSGPTYTMALFSFELSQAKSANDRANLTYQMLKWFECLTRYGRDLALSEEIIGKLHPDFMDEVNITVWLRNNGQDYEPVGSGDRVLVLFLMDNSPIPPYQVYINDTLLNASMTTNPVEVPGIPGDGGMVRVTMTWLANRVGTHAVRVSVDPFDFISEVNEDNNEVWGSATSQIVVRYSVLVVDDDDSPNNRAMGPNYNTTSELTRAFERLGYTATIYVVNSPAANGPTETYLRRFNTVIWLTGQCAPGAPNPITSQDETNLKGYLSSGDDRGLWLIGEDMFPSGSYIAGSFLYDCLHISSVTRGMGVPNPLLGVKDDPVGHGINYSISRTFAPATGGSILAPRADAQGVTYANMSNGTFNAVRYYSSSQSYRTMLCGWDLSHLTGRGSVPETEYEAEFAFMALRWLGMPETRIELRVTEMDLYYGNLTPLRLMSPSMGNSYVVKAVVANLGGTRGDSSVRFLDGGTVIGTSFVSVARSGNTIAEIIWTPLFAGARTISVQLDPDSVVPEIMKFNDRAGISLRSYFFYDDMENGTRNWKHEATIMRLNGESALEYMDIGNVSTGVLSSWQTLNGFGSTNQDYHSMNSSYFMKEPGAALDVVLVFDTSNSMSGTPLSDEKAAAQALVGSLTNDSRVAIFCMGANSGVRKALDFKLLGTDRPAVTAAITGLSTQGFTTLWQSIGEAMDYAVAFHDANKIPAIVALSDGQDYQGSDGTIGSPPAIPADYNQIEYGSNGNIVNPGYCPWIPWGTQQSFGSHIGKYFGKASTQGYWFKQTYGGNVAKGLLNYPYPVLTIGLNLEHDANLPAFSSTAVAANAADHTQNGFSVYTGAGSMESGTPEYNLWRISTTSPKGQYYFAPSSTDLMSVFSNVSGTLSSLVLARMGRDADGNAEASPDGGEGAASGRGPNIPGANDCFALTQSLDLRGVSTARLSFWQKYNIVMGYSGCVILVGTSADNTSFTYKYITPTQSYKGNIKTSINRFDDLGNEIRWAWNGISGRGAFDWEFAEANLNEFCGQQYVRIMFAYIRAGGGGGKGWWLDDIEVKVSRSNSVAVADTSMDQWELVQKGSTLGAGGDTADAWSGQYAWLCHNPSPSTDYLKGGLDNALVTVPIDLTNALDARLIAKFKFNLNYTDGRPPDGFRVEVSSDSGISWRPVHFGVRAAWKVSGTEAAGGDGKSFTGVDIGSSWVYSTTLARLNTDLSGWAGSVIQLRFRVVTRNDAVNHYHAVTGWGGFYIDDVTVFGNTTTGGRATGEPEPEATGPQASDARLGEDDRRSSGVACGEEDRGETGLRSSGNREAGTESDRCRLRRGGPGNKGTEVLWEPGNMVDGSPSSSACCPTTARCPLPAARSFVRGADVQRETGAIFSQRDGEFLLSTGKRTAMESRGGVEQ